MTQAEFNRKMERYLSEGNSLFADATMQNHPDLLEGWANSLLLDSPFPGANPHIENIEIMEVENESF